MLRAPQYEIAVRNVASLLRLSAVLPGFESQMHAQLVDAFTQAWGAEEAGRFADAVLAEAKARLA